MLGIGDVVGRISADEHVIGIDALGQVELLLCHLGLKMAYPTRSQALLGGLHHHLIAHYGRIDFTGIHLVIRAHPSVFGNATNKEDERSAKDRSITSKPRLTSSSLLQKLRRIQHHHTRRMIITSRRSNPPSLNNGIHHSLLHSPIFKLTTRIPTPSQIQITHNQALQIQCINPKQNKGYPKPDPAKRLRRSQSSQSGSKALSTKASLLSKYQPKFPMVVRKAKGRPRFAFERLCKAAGVRKQTVAGPSPPGHVPPINCSS